MRKNLKFVALKNGYVLNGEKIYVQSMLNVPSKDVKANILQAKALEEAGCEILRVAVPSCEDSVLVSALKKEISCPIVADIHYDHFAAIEAIKAGADKIRINPGNMTKDQLKEVAKYCKNFNVPIRIGVNSGSLEKQLLKKYGGPTVDALVYSAIKTVNMFEEEFNFFDIVVSIKASDVVKTVMACRKFRKLANNPLHIGVTEAGIKEFSIVKSSIGIGSLLLDSIGETLRVSITANPIEEIKAGHAILKALNLEKKGVEIISCPTCGRTKIDIIGLTTKVKQQLSGVKKNIKIAIMGCVVNGPGEAKDADIGIAGGDLVGVIFKKGKVLYKVKEEEILDVLLKEIEKM